MVQIIAGNKGKGKTKQLLDKVNAEVKTANGNIVYIDKSTKHMFELNNKVRLISATDYPLQNWKERTSQIVLNSWKALASSITLPSY